MKRLFTLLIMLGFYCTMSAQIAPDKYWIQFKDKNNSPYSIDKPEEFLSERSIQRRLDYGIAIDAYDIPVNPSYIQAVAECGAEILHPSKWLNGVSVLVENNSILDEIASLPFVQTTRLMEDDEFKQMIKEKSYFSNESYKPLDSKSLRDTDYGYALPQIEQLNGIALHEMGYQGQGMWIGVCDGGYLDVDGHEAFADMRDNGRLLGTRDYVYKNGIVYSDSSHGTSCLSLMAGNVPGKYVGTAPLASYFLCRTEDVNTENVIEEYNWVSAAEYLDSLGVDVISTSLGYITFDDSQWDHVYEDLDGETCIITIGSEIACSRGIMCVTSAGNEGANSFPYISAPADGENVFTIGAVGADGERAYFSSIGPSYDGRIKPDVMAHGYGVTVASPGGDSYYDGSGTSFSCPVLAGMLTCFWQANKHLKPEAIRETLRRHSDRFSNPDNEYGYGIPDFLAAFESLSVEENDDLVINSLISIFPNPSNGEVNLDINFEGKSNVKVFNQIGKLLYNNEISSDNVAELKSLLTELNQGLYLVKINGEEQNQVVKFIKY
ncbi:MAG: S8 family serine peptidase [Bacteroidales bacterium]|nr:S8 family serine peptidase [Bacteroidales bacterium]